MAEEQAEGGQERLRVVVRVRPPLPSEKRMAEVRRVCVCV